VKKSKGLVSTIFGIAVIVAAVSARAAAADDIETKAQGCTLCHGGNGVPTDPKIIPIIWGQQSSYLYKELHDYRSGARSNATMTLIAKGVTLPDLRQFADYFAAKTWPTKTWPAAPENAAAASPDAIAGKIEMCKACHQPHFEGGAPAPRLAGLSYEYLLSTMNGFADGQRTNNLDMPGFMKALSESDRDAIAKYLAGL
jgi:cytochrome c553